MCNTQPKMDIGYLSRLLVKINALHKNELLKKRLWYGYIESPQRGMGRKSQYGIFYSNVFIVYKIIKIHSVS